MRQDDYEQYEDEILIMSAFKDVYTEESIEAGDKAYTDELFYKEEMTFDEVVHFIKSNGLFEGSESHGVPRWVEGESIINYRTGESSVITLHPDESHAPTMRLWQTALEAADFPLRLIDSQKNKP